MTKLIVRESLEWFTIIAMGAIALSLAKNVGEEQRPWLLCLAVAFCLAKTTLLCVGDVVAFEASHKVGLAVPRIRLADCLQHGGGHLELRGGLLLLAGN